MYGTPIRKLNLINMDRDNIKVYLMENLSQETDRQRKILYLIMKAARAERKYAPLSVDTLLMIMHMLFIS